MDTLSAELLRRLHDEAIRRTGGCSGVLDEGRLERAASCPLDGFGDAAFYPSVFEKAAAMAHSLARNHPFVDGNKRTALLAASVLLDANGRVLEADDAEAEEVVVALATGEIDIPEFASWLRGNCTES